MRVQHIKRGSFYKVLGIGRVQADTPLTDNAEVIVYQSEQDNSIWVRPAAEFEDPSRFRKIKDDWDKFVDKLARGGIMDRLEKFYLVVMLSLASCCTLIGLSVVVSYVFRAMGAWE